VQAYNLLALLQRQRQQHLEDRVALGSGEHVAVNSVRVIGIEVLGDRRQ
jgi:hypothetical protein